MLKDNIKTLRKQKGYTQETFAQQLNVVRQTVSKWEKGYSVPDAIMLEKIAELLEVSISDLLGDVSLENETKPNIMQISEQLSILNNQFAKELARRRKSRKIILGIFIAIIFIIIILNFLFSFSLGVKNSDEEIIDTNNSSYEIITDEVDLNLDKAISEAIINKYNDNHFHGEFNTESHLIFGVEENADIVTVYLTENFEEFGFFNGFFTQISGHAGPAIYTFKQNGSKYELLKTEYPLEGGEFTDSVKKLFPNYIANKIFSGLSENETELLWTTQVSKAKAYLKSINRNAIVCKYDDIYTEIYSDYGISAEVSNSLLDKYPEYDYTLSNHEKIENSKRYVYQSGYDKENNQIIFTKFEYDTNNIVEYIVLDGESGNEIKDVSVPEKAIYKSGILLSRTDSNQVTSHMYYD